jgi:ribose transport system substrate-binding protein
MRSYGRMLMTVGAVSASLAFAACGSSDDDNGGGGGGDTTAAAADSGGGSSAVDDAKKVVELANGKLVYSAKEEPEGPADIEAYGDWRGPTEAPAHEAGKNVQIIVCTKASVACVQAAEGAKAAAEALGWSADILDGKGTPQGFSAAFDSAVQKKASAIITIAIPTPAVGDKIEQARKAGIITVGVGDKEPASGTKYDGYVPFPMPLMNTVLAYADIANTDGKSKSIVVEDPGFPVLVQSAAQYRKIIETCDGCEAIAEKWQITDAADPTKVGKIIQAAVSKNPDATTLALPYAIGLPAAVQAVAAAGKDGDIAIVAKDADDVGLKAVADGSSRYNAGSSVAWAGWAGVDQVVRGLAKEPYLGPTETGVGVVLFSKDNVPKDGNIETFPGLVDYKAKYQEIWKAG